MDSDGIWNACTIKVITNMAITTVPSKDCAELTTSAPRVVTTGRFDGAATGASGEATGTSGEAIGALEATKDCSGETTGWFDKFIEIYFSNLLIRPVECGACAGAFASPAFEREARNVRSWRAASCSAVFLVEPCARPTNSALLPFLVCRRASTVNVLLCSGPASSTRTYAGWGRPRLCTASCRAD